jgi:hypothetical protein
MGVIVVLNLDNGKGSTDMAAQLGRHLGLSGFIVQLPRNGPKWSPNSQLA